MNKKNGYIQLPYGFVENDNQKVTFNLPKNFKKELLFDDLPFVAQLNNAAIENVIKGKENDDISIQKFLLATGLLEDTIQNNLDMIVTDNEFNNAGVRRALDQKYPTIMGKPTATSFIFKDKAKFDIQNPIIGTAYSEILTEKQKENNQINLIGNAPSVTDLNIRKRLDELGKFRAGFEDDDDDDDDDDNNNSSSSGNSGRFFRRSAPPPPLPSYPTPPNSPASTSSIQRFLLDETPGSSRTAVLDSSTPVDEKKTVTFSKTLEKVFPKVKKELIPMTSIVEEDETEDFDISESTLISTKDGTIDLEFFDGGENYNKLFENASKNVGILDDANEKFLKYLSSNYGRRLLTKNKMKIHIESGKIFLDEKSTSESLYDFLKNQQDTQKKELSINIPIQNDFSKYVREILTNIVDDDYDLQTNSTSKFLFYNFNTIREHIERKPPIKIRHSEIIDDNAGLKVIQNYNWEYFVDRLLDISDNEALLEKDSFKDDEEFEDYLLIEKTRENLNYCKKFYNAIFDDLSVFFQRKIHEIPDHFIEKMEDDLSNHRIYFKSIKKIESHTDLMMIFSNFYFKTGRFPGFFELINVPPGVNPDFIENHDRISPFKINEKHSNTSLYGLASVQFMSALHIFFGGEKLLSKNVMSEFLHNLSLEALTIDDDKIEIQFFEIEELSRNLKYLMRDDERYEIEINDKNIEEEIFEAEKDKMEELENEIESNFLNKKTQKHPIENFGSFPNTSEEIAEESNREKIFQEKNEKSLNERDEEISSDLILESQKKLMKSLADNIDILVHTEISDISYAALPKVVTKEKKIDEHIHDTIHKDNQKFLKKSSSDKLKITPPRRSSKLKLSSEKPYSKSDEKEK